MNEKFMPELSDTERLIALKNNADYIEEKATYARPLTHYELEAKRKLFVDNSIKISLLKDELKIHKAEFKTNSDPIIAANLVLEMEVKTEKTQEKGTLFHMANQKTGYMESYDTKGNLITKRHLRPDEKHNLFAIPQKPAANDQ